MAKKMVLVSAEMLERLQQPQNTMPLTNPLKEQIVEKMSEIRNVANNPGSDESKAHRYSELYSSYTPLANKFLESRMRGQVVGKPVAAPVIAPVVDVVTSLAMLPKTLRESGEHLLNELKRHPNRVQWDSSNTVSIDGEVLRGSNIIDLIGNVLRTRKTKSPAHADAFLRLLADINAPDEMVRNEAESQRFRALKSGSRQSADSSSGSGNERSPSPNDSSRPPVKRKRVAIKDRDPVWMSYKS